MTLNAVVLPAPFGPIRPAIWPRSTENETSSRATTPPNRREMFSSSSSANSLRPALDEVEQPAEDAAAVRPQSVVLVLVRDPSPETRDARGRLLGELARDVHVLRVDRGGDRNLVLGQPLDVVELRPVVLGQDLRRSLQRLEPGVLVEHPRIDVLAREEGRILPQLLGE